ncbi:MAG: YihY/virulence factor BrkB family protein, partial [Ilumatobacteraceae bacterium]|nr:YihY/virulence factor BrkB family protein [Ilumatobacteraceae bacterium]
LTELFGFATSWALGVLALTLLLRYLTVVRVPWPSAIIGGAITAAMVAIGAVAIGAYLRRFATTSLAGATGSIFLFLIWMYYEAQIVLAGAELTRALADSASPDQREPGASPGNDAAVNVLD